MAEPAPPPGFVMMPQYSAPGGPPAPPPGFIPMEQMTDRKSGAPARVRQAVGSAPTDADRLSTIRKYYPDAVPTGGDNFTFTDPKTQRPTLYNPPGMDFGDVVSMAPEIGEAAGGTLGGMAAALAQAPAMIPSGGTSLLAVPAGVGLGAGAGREAMQLLAKGLVGTDDSRGLIEHLTDTGVTAGLNTIGMRAGEMLGQGVRNLARGLTGSARSPAPAEALANARAIGVDLPPGAVTGSTATQRIEKGLSILPGATDIVQRAYRNAADQLGEASADMGRQLAGGTDVLSKQGTGEVIRHGAQNAAGRFRARQGELYDAAYDLIGRDTLVPTPGVRALGDDVSAELARAPASREGVLNPVMDRIQRLLQDVAPVRNAQGQVVQGAGIPFDTLRAIRTDLGRLLDDRQAMSSTGTSPEQLRRLYGAMTEDIGAAARATSPEADRAMRLADRYTRFNLGTAGGRIPNAEVLQKVIDSGDGEKAFAYAMSGAKDGASRLNSLRRNLQPEEWDQVAATVWDQMGRAKPGQAAYSSVDEAAEFSPASLITNWNALSPEAKRTLFTSTRYADMAQNIDRIARTAQRLNEVSKQANFSNTANLIGSGGVAYGAMTNLLGLDLMGAAATVGAGYVLPRVVASTLMNSPRFVEWLAHVPVQGSPSQTAAHVGRLASIVSAEPAIRDEVHQFASALRDAPATKDAKQ